MRKRLLFLILLVSSTVILPQEFNLGFRIEPTVIKTTNLIDKNKNEIDGKKYIIESKNLDFNGWHLGDNSENKILNKFYIRILKIKTAFF